MREGKASRTAEYMALFRALETAQSPARRLFEDPFAAAFLGPGLRLAVRLARVPAVGAAVRTYIDYRWPGARTSAVARTRFIDDAVDDAMRTGADQVVILGAGFDARAYRLPSLKSVPVFEVDHPATSAAKRAAVEAALGSMPPRVRLVAVDFNQGSAEAALVAAGCDFGRRTMLLWEGVTNYLSAAAVDATLRWCATLAPGSEVLFTYVHAGVLAEPRAFHGTEKLFATLAATGERWTFGLDPAAIADYLAARGLTLEADAGAADYRAQCFGRAAVRMRGYEFYRIAVARVGGMPERDGGNA